MLNSHKTHNPAPQRNSYPIFSTLIGTKLTTSINISRQCLTAIRTLHVFLFDCVKSSLRIFLKLSPVTQFFESFYQ